MGRDWSPLAISDVLPGEAFVIRNAAERLAGFADTFARQASVLDGVEPDGLWRGLAAEMFASSRDAVPPTLTALSRRTGEAAGTLRTYATVVEDTQADGRDARDRAREAEEDIAAAREGIAAMAAHARSAAARARALNLADPDGPPVSPAPWTGPDWHARLADAEERFRRAALDFGDAVDDHRAGSTAAADSLRAADEHLDDPGLLSFLHHGALAWLRGSPDRYDFVVTDDGLVLNTVEGWRHEALAYAGIDPDDWDLSKDIGELDGVIVDAWTAYQRLYFDNPEQFLWAGLAVRAGGTLYGGFQDLYVLRTGLEDGSIPVREAMAALFPGGMVPGYLVGDLTADELAEELRFIEGRFVSMQRQIFDDMVWMHLAYQSGGLEALESIHASEGLNPRLMDGWRKIDTGDPDLIRSAATDFAWVEQLDIINDDYTAIREHSIVTNAITIGLSAIAADSPVPGGRPFHEVVPYEVGGYVNTPDRISFDRVIPDRVPFIGWRVPGGQGSIDLPDRIGGTVDLPLHDVSIFDNRWKWIEEDMLPAYLAHVDAGTIDEIVAVSIEEQGADARTLPDVLFFEYDPD